MLFSGSDTANISPSAADSSPEAIQKDLESDTANISPSDSSPEAIQKDLESDTANISPSAADSSPEAIQKDLVRCSLAMGVSSDNLKDANDTLKKISRRATHFLRVIGSIVPNEFSNQFKNPCWYANSTTTNLLWDTFQLQMQGDSLLVPKGGPNRNINKTLTDERSNVLLCMPYFFLAGFPKCGTSKLYTVLVGQLAIDKVFKEPQWWTTGPLARKGKSPEFYQHAVMMYLSFFFDVSQEISHHIDRITFDSSTATVWNSNFFEGNQEFCAMAAVLSRVLPNAKFIVMMRDPVSRLYSEYFQQCRSSPDVNNWPEEMRRDPAGHFHKQIVSDIALFDDCLKRFSLYECSSKIIIQRRGGECGEVGPMIVKSIYYIHILKWLQFFPREQFLFLKLEDMMDNPHAFMTQIINFLGLEDLSKEEAIQMMTERINARNIVEADAETTLTLEMREESKRILEEFYKPYNEMLDDLL